MRRVYDQVATSADESGVTITLDGKTVKTPAGRPLILPHAPLAEAVAEEWAAQGETIEPDSMPFMRLAATAIDRVTDHRNEVVDEIAAYSETDLLCLRAAEPADLKARQAQDWQPLLDWCAERFGARLVVAEGVIAAPQESAAVKALRAAVDGYDVMSLAALHGLTATSGSLIIALALADGHIDVETAWRLSRIDESFQAERWGEDTEARDYAERLRVALFNSARFLKLCNHVKIAS